MNYSTLLFFSFITPLVSGVISSSLFSLKRNNKIKGLLFHSLSPNHFLNTSTYHIKKFKKICSYLKENNYLTLTLKEANLSQSNSKAILLTFDDGLSSVYQYAFPVLLEYNIKATVFCTSGFIGKKSSWDVFSGNTHLNKEEIKILSENGIEIGSHTKTHPYLPYLRVEEIVSELQDSKKELEDIIGKEVSSLSFPFGGFNKKIWNIAKEIGYRKATTYRGKGNVKEEIYKVEGIYSFDSVADVIERIKGSSLSLLYTATSDMMSHFSKGTPLWKFRKNYNL